MPTDLPGLPTDFDAATSLTGAIEALDHKVQHPHHVVDIRRYVAARAVVAPGLFSWRATRLQEHEAARPVGLHESNEVAVDAITFDTGTSDVAMAASTVSIAGG